eukprot:TRINITY_DN40732_c0_g1_i1.p1 TRINITY_DN40732_c0_g1~~TRINITY_DN40732_c0_g1_i1.p1  ORF type:complete len:101 (-),score=18.97 TRINITY_DN40732_c0_g1_i1:47-325(-)
MPRVEKNWKFGMFNLGGAAKKDAAAEDEKWQWAQGCEGKSGGSYVHDATGGYTMKGERIMQDWGRCWPELQQSMDDMPDLEVKDLADRKSVG